MSTKIPDFAELMSNGHRYVIAVPNHTTDYIQGRLMREHRPYEEEMLKAMAESLTPGQLVIDVGANIGNHSIFLAVVAEARVVAFEPNKHLVPFIEMSAEANEVADQVEVRSVALGRTTSHAVFAKSIPTNLGSQSLSPSDSGDIAIERLDEQQFTPPVSAIKIDVEGMETDVLAGGETLIGRDRPLLWIESTNVDAFDSVAKLLSSWDYGPVRRYNATPTHLWIPLERLTCVRDLAVAHTRTLRSEFTKTTVPPAG